MARDGFRLAAPPILRDGSFRSATAYVVVEGDDLVAINERCEIPVEDLKAQNTLTLDAIQPGHQLIVATGGSGGKRPAPRKSPAYRARPAVPFAFNGKIDKIMLSIDRPKLTSEDEKKLMAAQRNNKTSE